MARDRASRPEARPLRLFVAADVPEGVRQRLEDAIAPIRSEVRGKWVPLRNWHVTLKFLGSTYPRLVDWVAETVEAVAAGHGPFESSLTGLGAFPNERKARILWAGLDDPEERLSAIAALSREFKAETRSFTAHLTVARFDPPAPLAGRLEDVPASSEPFPIDRLVVYRSRLQRPAPRYEPLREFPLGGR